MVLRQLAVGVDLDVQARGGAGEEKREEKDRSHDRPSMAHDPAGVVREQARCHLVVLPRALMPRRGRSTPAAQAWLCRPLETLTPRDLGETDTKGRDAARNGNLGMIGLEDKLPKAMRAMLLHVTAYVAREELVLRVGELRVAGRQTGRGEAEPLVGEAALGLGADHHVAGAELPRELTDQLVQAKGDGREKSAALPGLGRDREARDLHDARSPQEGGEPEVFLCFQVASRAWRDAHRPNRSTRADVLREENPGALVVLVGDRDVVAAHATVHLPAHVDCADHVRGLLTHAESVTMKELPEDRGLISVRFSRDDLPDVLHGNCPGRLHSKPHARPCGAPAAANAGKCHSDVCELWFMARERWAPRVHGRAWSRAARPGCYGRDPGARNLSRAPPDRSSLAARRSRRTSAA